MISPNHLRTKALKTTRYLHISLFLVLLMCFTGCATPTPNTVRLVSNPTGAKYTVYNKNGQEEKSVVSTDVMLYYYDTDYDFSSSVDTREKNI